jgi:hypothetical protein
VAVSQSEKISTRAPRFCVAYQAPHAVAGDGTHAVAAEAPNVVAGDGTHAVAGDGSHVVAADGTHAVAGDGSHAVTADRHARMCARAPKPPVELDAEGQALRERLRVFRTQAVRKHYKVSTLPPATLTLSPRVL